MDLWLLDWRAHPGGVSARHQGQNGAEDIPLGSLAMICEKLPLSPPAAPHAGFDLMTPERPIEPFSPTTEYPPATIKESPTQLLAPVTNPAFRSQNRSFPPPPKNTLSATLVRRSVRHSMGSK